MTMTPSHAVNAIQVLVGLSVLLLMFSGPWRQFVLDAVRQYLFQLRDRAFLLAADGKIAFTDPTYVEFRLAINRRIKYLHEYSIFDVMFMDLSKVPDDSILDRINLIEDREVREIFHRSCNEMIFVVLVSMVLRSFLFTLLLIPILVVAAVAAIVNGPYKLRYLSSRARGAVTRLGGHTQQVA